MYGTTVKLYRDKEELRLKRGTASVTEPDSDMMSTHTSKNSSKYQDPK